MVVVVAPLEIVARYEAPFRAAGMNPGLVTTSCAGGAELAPEAGLTVVAKLTGRVLTVLVRDKIALKLVRCLEIAVGRSGRHSGGAGARPSSTSKTIWAAARRSCCSAVSARRRTKRSGASPKSWASTVEPLRSPLGAPGENNAGLLGYLRSIAKNN